MDATSPTAPTASLGRTPRTDKLLTGASLSGEPARRARRLHRRRARRRCDTHPAFRNAARSIARLYDSLHDPAQAETLTAVDAFGIRTHKFFKPSRHGAGVAGGARGDRRLGAAVSYGFMGRTPDYKAAFMASLGCQPRFLRAVRR